MKLTVIGSADAFNSGGRGHSCYVIESEGAGKLMVDFGPTALSGLRKAGIEPSDLTAIAFTHLHGDHAAGFPFLVIDAAFNSPRREPLHVLGPSLTRDVLDALLAATYADVHEQVATLGIRIEELGPGEFRDVSGYRVTGFAADHMKPPHRPLCLRIEDANGKSVAFSGDTRLCPGLFAAAEGADLLVAECTRLSPPVGAHCTWEDWQRALPNVRAKSVLFSHLGSDVRARVPALAGEITANLPVQFADDGMVLHV